MVFWMDFNGKFLNVSDSDSDSSSGEMEDRKIHEIPSHPVLLWLMVCCMELYG